jgi:hypothetical protein
MDENKVTEDNVIVDEELDELVDKLKLNLLEVDGKTNKSKKDIFSKINLNFEKIKKNKSKMDSNLASPILNVRINFKKLEFA